MKRRDFLLLTAGLGAAIGTGGMPRRIRGVESSKTITGRVMGGNQPLEEVLVSDGRRVVKTDRNGAYRLKVGPDSGRFLFVSTPRDYWTDQFYHPIASVAAAGKADFHLQPYPQPDRFDFVFMTDMHLERQEIGIPKLRATLREINGLNPPAAFLLAQGDICLQAKVGPQYGECLELAKMPVRNGAGNHEMMLGHQNPRDDFEQRFGPTYYSFDWGGVHVIVLDGNKPIPGEQVWKAVHGAVEGSELAWLRADLEAQPAGRPIIVGVHIPIVSSYPERRERSPENAPYWEMTNRHDLTGLFARHGVRLVLQGHMHENERTVVDGVEYVASISVSGSWWKQTSGIERGVDNVPRGYRIVSVNGQKIQHRYQSSAESRVERQGEFDGLDDAIQAGGAEARTPFVFNCYDAPNGSSAEMRIDDGPWLPMEPYAAPSPVTEGLTMPHHFRSFADTSNLSPGDHRAEALVTYPDGTTIQEHQSFRIV